MSGVNEGKKTFGGGQVNEAAVASCSLESPDRADAASTRECTQERGGLCEAPEGAVRAWIPPADSPTIQAVAFVRVVHAEGPWTLTAIGEGVVVTQTFYAKDERSMGAWVEAQDGKRNVYYSIARGKAPGTKKLSKGELHSTQWFHVDLDPHHEKARTADGLAAEQNRLRELVDHLPDSVPEPTIVVFSGRGVQLLWRLSEPVIFDDWVNGVSAKMLDVEARNRWLAATLGGDDCWNADRILRVPGPRNLKTGVSAHLVSHNPSLVYALDAFERLETQTANAKPPRAVAREKERFHSNGANGPSAASGPTIDDTEQRQRMETIATEHYDPSRFGGDRSRAFLSSIRRAIQQAVSIPIIREFCLDPDRAIAAHACKHRSQVDRERAIDRAVELAEESLDAMVQRCDRNGVPIPGAYDKSLPNTRKAILKLGLDCSYDKFARRLYVQREGVSEYTDGITDRALSDIRMAIIKNFEGFDPGDKLVCDAVKALCYENEYHPVRDYIGSLEWDGVPRVFGFFATYLGAETTPYTVAVGGLFLVAAVRRIRDPGCKFDTIIVLEGGQGTGKSTTLRTLAGDEFFCDQELLSEDNAERAQLMQGVWIYEVSELTGLGHRRLEEIKAFASRQDDRTRVPYGRTPESFPRQCILVGTTNKTEYLYDDTGERRFLPIRTGNIDIVALTRDRDQLWAEACELERLGHPIYLPSEFRRDAEHEQARRKEHEPWIDLLGDVEGTTIVNDQGERIERIHTATLLGHDALMMTAKDWNQHTYARLARAMRALGWNGPKQVKIDGKNGRGYERCACRKAECAACNRPRSARLDLPF